MFKKHLLLVMCLGTYVAAMADGGYIVSYTDDIDAYSKENVATITESESSSSTLQEVINDISKHQFKTSGLKKVKIKGKVSDVTALSDINCATIDLSEADLPSIINDSFTNKNVKYVVLPNGMAKSDVNTWAKSRFTSLESAASASYAIETQSKWVYDNDVVYEGEVTDNNGTTAKGKISVDVSLTVVSSSYKNGDAEYNGTVLVGSDNKAYGISITDEENLVNLTAATGYTYKDNGPREVYTGEISKQEDGTLYGYLNPTNTYTLLLNQSISYTYGNNGEYAYTGRVYGNVYNALKYLLEGGQEVKLTKLENTTNYLYYEGNITYIYDGPTAQSGNVGHVGGTQVELTVSNGTYTYINENGESVTYTGTVFGENIGYIGGKDITLDKQTWPKYYYTEDDKKIVYKGDFISDDNYGYVGNNISSTQLTVLSSPEKVNYYEENGKLVIYSGKVYGENTAYVGGNVVTLDYGTYYKNGDSVYEGMRTADNTKGYTGNDAFLLTAAFTYSYTDPNTNSQQTFASTDVLTTLTVEKTVVLTQKEVDMPTGKIILTAYVKTPGTLVYTIMQMSVFHDYSGGGWQSWANSQSGWYITGNEGGYLYKTENVRDLILSGNLNAVDMNTGGTCVDNDQHYSASGPNNWNALPFCKPEKIDLSDALFVEGENYNPQDMTISGYYAGSIKEIILPTADSQNTIPDDFMNNCEGVQSLCIPYNYEIIGKRAFFNAHGLTHIYTTDPSNTEMKTDHGDGSFTFSANLKEIRSVGNVDAGTFFGDGMQVKVFDIYNLAVEAPKCGAYAFQGDLTYGNNGFKGNWTHPICRENYINNGHVICMLHYPTESKTYTRPGGTCVEAANYEDITRVYTLADETGAVDGSGNTRAWPRHAEFYRSFNQAVSGHTWYGWKLYQNDKEVVSSYYEGVVEDPSKTYNKKDYQGWHEFVLTENNIFVPFDPQNRYENFVENDWYTICVPYDIKKSELLMALGVKAGINNKVRRLKKNADGTTGTELEATAALVTEDLYPDVRTLVQVKRSVNERKVTLCLSEPLVTADRCQKVSIPDDRQGYEYTELKESDPVVMKGGYPYLVRPFIPEDNRIKNIGAYVVAVASQNNFTRPPYTGGLGDTERSAAGTTFSLPVREGVETQALNKDKTAAQGSPVYVKLDDSESSPCMYNFVGTYLNGNVPQYGYYLGKNKNTGKHQFFRTTKTTTKWNQYSAIIKGFTKPEFYIPSGADSKTIENVRRIFTPDQADDLIILKSESPTNAGKAMTLILDDSGEDDNTTTAIRDIDMNRNMDNSNKVYTIGGMLTNGSNRLQKGIYIKNGKKHVVK